MIDDEKLDELKKQTKVDNSKLEDLMAKEITPEMQVEFFETLKQAQLYLPVTFSPNMFEGIENSKPGDVHQTTGREGFDINFLTSENGEKAVPLFTSDKAMETAGLRSSVMVMFAQDIADMLKQSDRYSIVAINPLTPHDINMPFEAFIHLFEEPSEEEKQFIESLNEILKALKEHSCELEQDMAFMLRHEENVMREASVDGVFIPNIPMNVSSDPDFRKDLKYANILLFPKGKKVLPLGRVEKDQYDTIIAPGTELILYEEIDEYTTVWKCESQPFYD